MLERRRKLRYTSTVIRGLIKSMRPHQWVKNALVAAPMFFHKDLFFTAPDGAPALNLVVSLRAMAAVAVFCLLAGAVYLINDLADVEGDRAHPVKRFRPIASGDVPEGAAKGAAAVLVILSLSGALLLDPRFFGVAFVYFAQNLLYTFKLKKIAFVDVSLIALGFVLRVLAGGYATHTVVSSYMIGCVALLALFLGFGKRRHEIGQEDAAKQRSVLSGYSVAKLDAAMAVTGLATVAVYTLYTLDESTRAFFHSDYLWVTVPFTALGMGRFLMLVSGRARPEAESPTQAMLTDVPMVLVVVGWLVTVISLVYRLRPAG